LFRGGGTDGGEGAGTSIVGEIETELFERVFSMTKPVGTRKGGIIGGGSRDGAIPYMMVYYTDFDVTSVPFCVLSEHPHRQVPRSVPIAHDLFWL
jgi:hypothetical protein